MKINKLKGTIYKVTNLVNEKIYIGQTSHKLNKRIYGHNYDSFKRINKKSINLLHRAIVKHGWKNFKFEILQEIKPRLLDIYERYYIKKYKSNDKKFGYNLTSGGTSFNVKTKELIDKMKKSHQSKKEGYINPNKGKVLSEEIRVKMRKPKNLTEKQRKIIGERSRLLHTGKKLSSLRIENLKKSKYKPINQFTSDKLFIKRWGSISEACKELKTSPTNISECLTKKQKTACGYKWEYA